MFDSEAFTSPHTKVTIRQKLIFCLWPVAEFGLACHLGVLSGLPCVGVAKKLLHVQGVYKNEEHQSQVRPRPRMTKLMNLFYNPKRRINSLRRERKDGGQKRVI